MQGRRNAPAKGAADRKTGGNQGLNIGKNRSGTKTGGKAEKNDDDETKKDEEEEKSVDDEKKTDEEDSKR